MKATTTRYAIQPAYYCTAKKFEAQWQLVRLSDNAILRALELTRDNLEYLKGYADALNYDYCIL